MNNIPWLCLYIYVHLFVWAMYVHMYIFISQVCLQGNKACNTNVFLLSWGFKITNEIHMYVTNSSV